MNRTFPLCFPLLCASLLFGQAPPTEANQRARGIAEKLVNNMDPAQNTLITPPGLQFNLLGTKDKGSVTGTIGVGFGASVAAITLSAPLGEEDKEAAPVSLDGLANKATVGFKFNQLWNPHADPVAQENFCVQYLVEVKRVAADTQAARDLIDKGVVCSDQLFADDDTLLQKWLELAADPAADAAAREKLCIEYLVGKKFAADEAAARQLLRTRRIACSEGLFKGDRVYETKFLRLVTWSTPIFAAGFKIGRETYRYVESPAYADLKSTKSSYEGSASIGTVLGASTFIQGTYRYQSAYQGQTASNICTPLDGATSLRCRTIAVGAPERTIKNLIQFELRKLFSINGVPGLSRLGIGPQLTYDTRADDWGISIPVYFLQNSDGGLNGGIALGWQSATKGLSASVFIGDLFALITQ